MVAFHVRAAVRRGGAALQHPIAWREERGAAVGCPGDSDDLLQLCLFCRTIPVAL